MDMFWTLVAACMIASLVPAVAVIVLIALWSSSLTRKIDRLTDAVVMKSRAGVSQKVADPKAVHRYPRVSTAEVTQQRRKRNY